ncbi:hypothetical protein EXIGLDRAFT_833430 [Exidia glandulosa HHB12029]|uniref:ORC1/DEAH AAA+ ATPase domain-containing protein n=1 Tax=Exidia glandulosa HHB12029 TaxID=1314781 RepID=A0A165KR22_EXIGL|nr:hypothetical protein EXIGLDRAFT_833430 [Exidia glandulosa HHB12029]
MSITVALAGGANAAAIAGEPISHSLLGVAQLINDYAQGFRVNKQAAISLSQRIGDFVDAAIGALEEGHNSQDWEEAVIDFQRNLLDARDQLQRMNGQSHLVQLLHRDRNEQALKEIASQIDNSFQILKLCANMDMLKNVTTVTEMLETAVPLLEAARTREAAATIPPPLQRFFGRSDESQRIVTMFISPHQAFAAVLGGPGMGKTSVAVTVFHAPEICARFGDGRRFFVTCDAAAESISSLLATICASLGIVTDRSSADRKALRRFLSSAPCFLVLDNFESAWEADVQRKDAEDLLEFLASIETVSFLLTMRGMELPQGPSWTRPHVPPLSPLADDAATQLFVSISDVRDEEPELRALLKLVGNVPLAVTLMAYLAQFEPLGDLVSRWRDVKTSLLKRSHGRDRLTSLNISIELSLSSPRMQAVPTASLLLGMLSLLPQGAHKSSISEWSSELDDSGPALTTLLQTALASRIANDRVHVLPPIRDFMLSQHAPSEAVLAPLYAHYFAIVSLLDSGIPDATDAIVEELENIYSVISYGLDHQEKPDAAIKAAYYVTTLFQESGFGSSDLLPRALAASRSAGLAGLTARLLWIWASLAQESRVPGVGYRLALEAQALYRSVDDFVGIADTTLFIAPYLPTDKAIASCREVVSLASEHGDALRVAKAHYHMATSYLVARKTQDALEPLALAIDGVRALGSAHADWLGMMLDRRADLTADFGDVVSAIRQWEEAIPLLECSHRLAEMGQAQKAVARLLLAQGDLTKAEQLLQSALRQHRASRYSLEVVLTSQYLVSVNLAKEDERAASELLRHAENVPLPTDEEGKALVRVTCLLMRAELALFRNDYDEAHAILHAALIAVRGPVKEKPHTPLDMLLSEVEVHDLFGRLHMMTDSLAEARTSFVLTAVIWRHIGSQTGIVPALSNLAQVLEDDKESMNLLLAVILPLQRWGYRPAVAEALLHSACIALRRNQHEVALRRARRALHLFGETGNRRGCERASALIDVVL